MVLISDAWKKGAVEPDMPYVSFVMDVQLEANPDALSKQGYEFLMNEFAGEQRIGACRPGVRGKVHILGSHNTVIQTYRERGFEDVKLGPPLGDPAVFGPEFAVAVYVKRSQERSR